MVGAYSAVGADSVLYGSNDHPQEFILFLSGAVMQCKVYYSCKQVNRSDRLVGKY